MPGKGLPVRAKYTRETPAYSKITDRNLLMISCGSLMTFFSLIRTAR